MRKPIHASKKSRSTASHWKHPRKVGKRMANKSERGGSRRSLEFFRLLLCPLAPVHCRYPTSNRNRRPYEGFRFLGPKKSPVNR